MAVMDMSERAVLHVKRDVLLEASEDSYSFWAIYLDVWEDFGHARGGEVRELVLNLVRDLLEKNLAYAGDLDEKTGNIIPWGESAAACLQRIARGWTEKAQEQMDPELAWFKATARGEEWVQRYYVLLSELGG